MAHCAANSDENFLSLYRIDIHVIQSRLAIGAEHRQTKKVYRGEIDQDAIPNITQGVCETSEHRSELLQELVNNNVECENKSLKVLEQDSKLILNVTLVVSFGRILRRFNMQFELGSVRLDDITRLEKIIAEYGQRLEQLECSVGERFDCATKLTSLWENDVQF